MLPSFSQSRDHPYSKLLSQTMTITFGVIAVSDLVREILCENLGQSHSRFMTTWQCRRGVMSVGEDGCGQRRPGRGRSLVNGDYCYYGGIVGRATNDSDEISWNKWMLCDGAEAHSEEEGEEDALAHGDW
jgi:hypothetical protein